MQNGTAGEKIDDDKKDDARKNVPETTNEPLVMNRKWEQAGKSL